MGKFKIPTVSSTTNKTVRFPNNKIDRVDKAIQGKDCTFPAFVISAFEYDYPTFHLSMDCSRCVVVDGEIILKEA